MPEGVLRSQAMLDLGKGAQKFADVPNLDTPNAIIRFRSIKIDHQAFPRLLAGPAVPPAFGKEKHVILIGAILLSVLLVIGQTADLQRDPPADPGGLMGGVARGLCHPTGGKYPRRGQTGAKIYKHKITSSLDFIRIPERLQEI